MNKNIYFSSKEYENLIKFFKDLNYKFVFFSKNIQKKKNIILRHDVDIDITKAYEMAKIEKKLKVRSTYFFLTTSKLYNCLEETNQDLIKKIHSFGHEIGLHFDLSNYKNCSNKTIINKFELEKKILEECINSKVKFVSFHKPGINGMPKKLYYNKLLNAYNSNFIKEILYYSDSKGSWRFGTPFSDKSIFELRKSLQLLVHPVWWISKKKLTEKNNSYLLKNLLKLLNKKNYTYLQSYKKFI